MRNLRAILRMILLFLMTIGVYSLWFVLNPSIPNKQFWRQYIFSLWAKLWLRINHIEVEVIGHAPKPPFFLVSNHLGYVDIPVLRSAATGVFVAKHDIRDWFAFGRMIRNIGMIYVNRGVKRDIPRAGAEVIERLSAGEGVIVFPEGTSSCGDGVLPFNSSFLEFAAQTDTPVSYATITYRTPAGEPPPSEAVCWWDDTPFLVHAMRLLAVPRIKAIVTFGTEPVSNPDRKHLAAELRKRVSESFIPML